MTFTLDQMQRGGDTSRWWRHQHKRIRRNSGDVLRHRTPRTSQILELHEVRKNKKERDTEIEREREKDREKERERERERTESQSAEEHERRLTQASESFQMPFTYTARSTWTPLECPLFNLEPPWTRPLINFLGFCTQCWRAAHLCCSLVVLLQKVG